MHDSNHLGGIILTLDGILPACRSVLVGVVDPRTLRIEAREEVRDVGCEPPWFLQEGVGITPRRLEVVLTAIEVGEEKVHPLH